MNDGARILFVGDISLGGDFAKRHGGDRCSWAVPFEGVHGVFEDADLRIGNLEEPLHRSSTPRRKKNLLGAPPEAVAALSYLGFTALSLGNNHITDQGAEGITRTREILELNGISPFGAGENIEVAAQPAFAEANGQSFAFLAYAVSDLDVQAEEATRSAEGCVPLSLDRVERDLDRVRRETRHVVVSLHWGYQYDRYPDPAQVDIARRIIDLGAVIVFGHHPHVVQGIERYKHGLILYSMGNFVFPSFDRTDGWKFRFPRASRRTAAVLCDVGTSGVQSFSTVPLAVDRNHRVRIVRGRAAARQMRALELRSRALGSTGYASQWRSHHRRTERMRRRQEEMAEIRGESLAIWRRVRSQGIVESLRNLKGHHVSGVFRLLRRYSRL